MCHQVIVSLRRSGSYGGNSIRLHGSNLGCRFISNLKRQPSNQSQCHHGSNGRKCEISDTLGSTLIGSNHGRFGLQSLMKGFLETFADVVRLSQCIANQMIVLPIVPNLRMSFELVQKGIRLILEHLTVHQCRNFLFHIYHLVFSFVPNKGRRLVAIASRALKILDLTVPIGQSITAAISS
jgi:hypothetical protein